MVSLGLRVDNGGGLEEMGSGFLEDGGAAGSFSCSFEVFVDVSTSFGVSVVAFSSSEAVSFSGMTLVTVVPVLSVVSVGLRVDDGGGFVEMGSGFCEDDGVAGSSFSSSFEVFVDVPSSFASFVDEPPHAPHERLQLLPCHSHPHWLPFTTAQHACRQLS